MFNFFEITTLPAIYGANELIRSHASATVCSQICIQQVLLPVTNPGQTVFLLQTTWFDSIDLSIHSTMVIQ